MDPPVLPTLAALQGVHAFARVDLAFGSLAPLPSGGRVQADLLETYLLFDQRVIEPGMRRQDFQVHRFALSIDAAGKPFLRTAGGLSVDLPVRMSRTFGPTELVEGLIDVGVYQGAELLASTGELLGPGGGSFTRDGITFVLGAGAAQNPVLVRLQADPASEVEALWPELKDLGRVALSFQIEIIGALQQGYGLTMADLGTVSEGQKPLLVQHKLLQGRRRALAVGAFELKDGAWALRIPAEGNPLLAGGEFAVLVPNAAWDWVTGRCVAPKSLLVPGGSATEDQAVPEVYVLGGLLLAGSGPEGRFALPAVPAPTLSLTGRQDDLGIQGLLTVAAPSSGNILRLTGIPFRLLSLEPAEGEEVGAGLVIQALFTTQADGNALSGVHLIQTGAAAVATVRPRDLDDDETGKSLQVAQPPGGPSFLTGSHRPSPAKKNNQPVRTVRASEKSKKRMASSSAPLASSSAFAEVEIPLRRSLLLTPERGLDPGASFRLELSGLKSTQGEVLDPVTRRFTTHPLAPAGAIALDRITLSYPDADLNVTVTIPEGAIPPWSLVELTAEGFGSTFMGTMPPSGPLGATLRAALGEEIRIAGSTPDHRGFLGILSRYVALDGRTTLGKRGGRIEGPQGLAVVLAPGSLTEPIEFRVEVLDAAPELAENALVEAERMMPGLRLRASKAVDLLLPPRIELPISQLPGDLNLSLDPNGLGNGPVAVIRREVRTLPDGSEDVVNVLMDTAQVSGDGAVIRGLGGLRYGGELSTAVAMKANKVPGTLGIPVGRVLVSKDGSRSLQSSPSSPPSLFNKKEKSLINRDKGDEGDKRTDPVPAASSVGLDRPLAFNLSGALLDVYLLGSGTVPARHPVYHSGYALRNWNGSRGAASLPEGSQGLVSAGAYNGLPNAEIYRYTGTVGLDQAVQGRLARGRLLSTCDAAGRYVSIGGPSAGLSDPNQTWIALFALDPRTGETSLDPGSPHIGEPGFERYQPSYDHWILITSRNDPFDPSLAPPRLKVRLVDGQGQSQNLFPVGDAATLVVGLEAGSQAVGRGKISGDLELEFGSLGSEQRFPVTFAKEGAWKVDVEGWSAIRNVRALSTLEAVVVPQSKLGPSLSGAPRIIAWTPEKDDKNVEPSTQVRISFNEPLASVSRADFSLRQDGQDVAFRLVAGGREVTAASGPTQEVLLLPLGRLSLGKSVEVRVGALLDRDGEAFSGETCSFTVREADELGRLGGLGSFRGMVANQGYLYAIEEAGTEATSEGILYPSYAIRMLDARDPSAIKKLISFGGHGTWEDPAQPTVKSPLYLNFWAHKPFHNHEVRGLRVAKGVGGTGAEGKDLLLVWSSPWVATEPYEWTGALVTGWLSRHSSLWVFDITGDPATWPGKVPRLVTSISLGTQSESHGIGVGQSGSLLGVLRRRNGLSLWDAKGLEDGFQSDATALEGVIGVGPGAQAMAPFDAWGKAVLAWRAQTQKGYYPPPAALAGDNALRYEAATGPTVLSAALGTGDDSKAVMAAVMGYGAQKLYLIDSRQGTGEAKVTYMPGGPNGLDGRMTDISEPFGAEKPTVVEMARGQWQGASGSEEGLLLLVATRPNPLDLNATAQNLWVLQVKGDDRSHTAIVLAKGPINGIPKFIQIDPVKMLVAVRTQTGGAFNEEIFDLKVLQPTGSISAQVPMALNRIAMIANGQGASALFEGMLAIFNPWDKTILGIKHIEGPVLDSWHGIPVQVDASKFFAGAFYDYTKAMLGDPNPDLTPQLEPKLMYTMIRAQDVNNKTPYLRHYYPDLGERYLTATVKMGSPNREKELYDPKKDWFMEGTGSLFVRGREIVGAVVLEGQTVVNGQLVANSGSSRSKLSPTEFTVAGIPDPRTGAPLQTYKTISAPYRFFIKPDVLAQYDAELRGDRNGTSFVRIEFKLYENDAAFAEHRSEGEKRLEFTVKFNSNTTLFDVVRGGAWHYDPIVSGDQPWYQSRNPLIQGSLNDWMTRQFANISATATFNEAVTRRLSRGLAEPVPGDPDRTATRFQNWGLSEIQSCLEQVMPALRRRIFVNQNPANKVTERMPHLMRPTFAVHDQRKRADGTVELWERGDLPGAFGYLTAQVVNGIQRLESVELGTAGNTKPRTIDEPTYWQHDPGMLQDDFDKQRDGRIAPVINQRFRIKGELNPTNTLVQYWVAYPRLRTQGQTGEYAGKGLDAINTMLTRDLVLGPTDPDFPEDVEGRQPLNDWLQAVNVLPERKDYVNQGGGTFDEKLDALFQGDWGGPRKFPDLISSHEVQPIFRAARNTISIFNGQWFNSGIGILQLAFHEYWGRPFDKVNPGYNPLKPNEHMMVIARKYDGSDSSLDSEISDFLLMHFKARSIAVYVNGVLTLGLPMEEGCDLIQQRLDMVSGIAKSDPFPSHIPVIGSYNETGARYNGGANLSDFDIGDVKDCIANLKDCMNPTAPTNNGDTQRLIWVMRSVARVINNPAFAAAYLALWAPEPGGEAKGRDQLALLRLNLTLHAHSQGSRIAASARSRLGKVPSATPGAQALDVLGQYDFVDYGNAATLGMWWSYPTYRSHLHHINRYDFFPAAVGLTLPDSTGAPSDDLLHGVTLPLQFIGIDTAPAHLTLLNGLASRVTSGILPDHQSAGLYARYFKDLQNIGQHVFVMHGSTCYFTGVNNHDIINAYSCNAGGSLGQVVNSPLTYTQHPRWTWVYEGPPVCEQGDCGSINNDTAARTRDPLGALVVDILGLPEGERGFVQVYYSEDGVGGINGGGTLWKSGRLSSQYPGPMDVTASPIQTSDGRNFKPVQAVQHIQIKSGVELHITVTYVVAP